MEYERIYPPDYTDKRDPKCPDCGEPMFYVGVTAQLSMPQRGQPLDKSNIMEYKLYQCVTCRKLFQET